MKYRSRSVRAALWPALLLACISVGGCFRGKHEAAAIEACKRLELSHCEKRGDRAKNLDYGIRVSLIAGLDQMQPRLESVAAAYNRAILFAIKDSMSVDLLKSRDLQGVFGEALNLRLPERLDQTLGYLRDVPLSKTTSPHIRVRQDLSERRDFSKVQEICERMLAGSCLATLVIRADVIDTRDGDTWRRAGWVDIIDYSITPMAVENIRILIYNEAKRDLLKLMLDSPELLNRSTISSLITQRLDEWDRRLNKLN
jgi:hypothetical protein